MKKYIAEALGTFGLTLAVLLSIGGTIPVSTPLVAALTLGLFVYTLGSVSGTHINPAITVGLFMINKISMKDALWYIVSQIIGAIIAMYFVKLLIPMPTVTGSNDILVGLAEFIGTFFFAFGVAAVATGKTPHVMNGFLVGGSLFLGILLAVASGSNGVLNPAVALGIKSISLMYLAAPIIGSVCGMWAYKFIAKEGSES